MVLKLQLAKETLVVAEKRAFVVEVMAAAVVVVQVIIEEFIKKKLLFTLLFKLGIVSGTECRRTSLIPRHHKLFFFSIKDFDSYLLCFSLQLSYCSINYKVVAIMETSLNIDSDI